jgi:hypothetical protein
MYGDNPMKNATKGFMARNFGNNQGVELIASRLRDGYFQVNAYNHRHGRLYEFRGTGIYLGGRGNQKEYFIEFRYLQINDFGYSNYHTATDWVKLSRDTYEFEKLQNLDDSDFRDLIEPAPVNDEAHVVEALRKVANRLKPHQFYQMAQFAVSSDMFTQAGYRLYSCNRDEINVPTSFITSARLVTQQDLERDFEVDRVKILNEDKIARQHRPDRDLKRWYVVEEVKSIEDRHAIRFTHRSTAGDKVKYFRFDIDIDSRNQFSKPFYVTELLEDAVKKLEKTYSASQYQLELFVDNILISVPDVPKMSLADYVARQVKHPTNADTLPILIHDKPRVRHTVNCYGYSPGWHIETQEKADLREKENDEEKGKSGRRK